MAVPQVDGAGGEEGRACPLPLRRTVPGSASSQTSLSELSALEAGPACNSKVEINYFSAEIYFEEKSLHFDVCRAFLWGGVGTIYHKVPISDPGSGEA